MSSVFSIIRSHGLLITLGLVTFLATCVAAAPAALFAAVAGAGRADVAYYGVEGTVWRGKISKLSVSGTLVGDVEFRLSPLSLLTLTPRAHVHIVGGAVRGEGSFSVGAGRRFTISNANFDIDVGPFARRGVLGMPVQGEAQIKITSLRISSRGCLSADGAIWTNVLEAPAKQYRSQGFPLSGKVACDAQDLFMTLAGEGPDGGAGMSIRVTPDLTYELTATAQPTEDEVATVLRYFGFEDNDSGLIYGSAGVLRGVGS